MLSASSIIAKYRRAKLNASNTVLWEDLAESKKNEFLTRIKLNDGEKCLIIYYNNEDYFWVFTSFHLIVGEKPILYVEYNSIKEVRLPSFTANPKINETFIELVIENGSVFLQVEENTWHFVYELLRFLK